MTCSVLRVGIGACLLAVSTSTHAATPMTLPFGDIGPLGTAAIDLPVPPPPPQVARPDVTQMRLIIKPQPVRGCDPDEPRRATDRRQATSGPDAPGASARPTRWG